MEQINARSIFSAATGPTLARSLLAERLWTQEDYQRCVDLLRKERQVYEGRVVFFHHRSLSAIYWEPDDYFSPQSHASRSDHTGSNS